MKKTYVPPIKIQGIKTKLVPAIKENILLRENTIWIEPFMGSGVVGFNVNPQRAVFSDKNPHIIRFYTAIQSKEITAEKVRSFLETESEKLKAGGGDYYNEVRQRFNILHAPLDFLFLNRSCFNGMIRFNKDHKFNVPFGHKPNRFSKAYITKIVNQVKKLEELMEGKDWTFVCQSYETALVGLDAEYSFVYCDPPYLGRNVDYYDSWDLAEEEKLQSLLFQCGARFMLSTWDYNKYRKNSCIDTLWKNCNKINQQHYYFVGGKESNRNSVMEALLINYSLDERSD